MGSHQGIGKERLRGPGLFPHSADSHFSAVLQHNGLSIRRRSRFRMAHLFGLCGSHRSLAHHVHDRGGIVWRQLIAGPHVSDCLVVDVVRLLAFQLGDFAAGRRQMAKRILLTERTESRTLQIAAQKPNKGFALDRVAWDADRRGTLESPRRSGQRTGIILSKTPKPET